MSLTRDDQHHYYWRDRRVPGVTEIIQGVGLIDTTWFTEEGRARGTYVHAACQYLLEDDLAWDEVDNRYRPWVESFARWRDAVRPEVIELETLHYNHAYGYAGQPDWVLRINDDVWLIDGKSGQVLPWAGLQTAAYERFYEFPVRRASLKLRSDGKQAMLKPQKDDQDWPDFVHCLGAYNAKIRLQGGWDAN